MKVLIVAVLFVIMVLYDGAMALGGAFGARKGGSYTKFGSRPPSFNLIQEREKPAERLLEALLENEDDQVCMGKKCLSNDHCCPGSVCVAVDEVGTCLPVFTGRRGELCQSDTDCVMGLSCRDNQCQPENRNDECDTSSECDVERGLCCQMQRRHRQAARKTCVYFKDPRSCIGNVETSHKLTDSQKEVIKTRLG